MADIPVKCTRCRNQHRESERVLRPRPRRSASGIQMSDTVCPCCGSKVFYSMRPQVAWCWPSGLIEVGDAMPDDEADGSGAIQIASGPEAFLTARLSVLARHGQGASARELLVPGVPEADGQTAKVDALCIWLAWCGKRKPRDGVVFCQERTA